MTDDDVDGSLLDQIQENARILGKLMVQKISGESVPLSFWMLRKKQLTLVNTFREFWGLPPHGPIEDL